MRTLRTGRGPRRALTLALAAGTLAALTTAPAHAVGELTVLSFNIHHAQGTDDVLDLERTARVIRSSEADVVGLQEVDKHFSERSDWADQAGELAELLGYHVAFGANIDRDPPAQGRPRVQYGTAVLSRYPITSAENTHLTSSPGEEQRGLLHAELDVDGVPVHLYNTHLAAGSEQDRLSQAREIVDLAGSAERSVLVGDLNALPGAPEIRTLDEVFTDAWTAGDGDGATYPSASPDRRIDYVLTGGSARPVETKVLDTEPEASDHLPVVSRVEIP
ncbi:endonuclease/exonuclease/phosphatase family protein [Prauserella cavernicola]|uniref:Endonuclease/exonuclease/phosphatase family protein n=1 Tax=Prauserella cavernicola TaxID=2800127 RepID=A0A934QVS1_9PSEU|nr:endonuclease/exonuclease/phosphatase family protein [Prauserella cavernicola]MBK1786224.1 endonuclease/exonuclease/phosphatase family protein [Prauserella cavernicola]